MEHIRESLVLPIKAIVYCVLSNLILGAALFNNYFLGFLGMVGVSSILGGVYLLGHVVSESGLLVGKSHELSLRRDLASESLVHH